MNQETLKFVRKPRPRLSTSANAIRVSAPAYNAVNEIAYETGRTVSSIASEMLLYAYKHSELIDVERQEKT